MHLPSVRAAHAPGRLVLFLVLLQALASAADTRIDSQQPGAEFAWSVAPAGDVNGDGYDDIVVGAYAFDVTTSDEGAVFVFHGGAGGIDNLDISSAATTLLGDQTNGIFGFDVQGAGDVNGDGYDDIIVGGYSYDGPELDEGRAWLYLGSASGIPNGGTSSADAVFQSNQVQALFGSSVAAAGDVNMDGYDDIIIGAYTFANGEAGEGGAWIFHGSVNGIPSGDPTTADTQLEGDQIGATFGYEVNSAGDVNGDGYSDVIVSALIFDAGENNEGGAFVFLGGPAGVASGGTGSAHASFHSNEVDGWMGRSVAGIGDVNGDGYGDVAVTSVNFGDPDAGGAFVFLGSATGLTSGDPASAHARILSDFPDTRFGASVNPLGDLDGDGYDDFVVGSYQYETGEVHEGAAFVFRGSAGGIPDGGPATAARRFDGNLANARFGASSASAGDVDGDGTPDIVIGAYRYSGPELHEGVAFLYQGPILSAPVPALGAAGLAALGLLIASLGFRRTRQRRAGRISSATHCMPSR